jgi:hypothetical protein
MEDRELTRQEAAQAVRTALKGVLERGLAQAQAVVEEVRKAEDEAKGKTFGQWNSSGKREYEGKKVKCAVCKGTVHATSAGLVGYHSQNGVKCSGNGSDPDRGQYGKPRATLYEKSEPMAKAWRAGGPRPASGPLAPKPEAPKPPAEKVAKSVPVGTGIAQAMRLTVAQAKVKPPTPKPVQNTPAPAKKTEAMTKKAPSVHAQFADHPVSTPVPKEELHGPVGPTTQRPMPKSPGPAKLPGMVPPRAGGYRLPGTGPKATPPPIPAAAAVHGANKQLGGFQSLTGRTPKLAMKSESMCKSCGTAHLGKCMK